jgi:nucleotide-binding universal stress UspA family protein
MYPFRRILIPTDFSTASEWVFDDGVRFAGATGAELVILHIRMTRTSQPERAPLPRRSEAVRIRGAVRARRAAQSREACECEHHDAARRPAGARSRRGDLPRGGGREGRSRRDRDPRPASRRAPHHRLDDDERHHEPARAGAGHPLRHPQTDGTQAHRLPIHPQQMSRPALDLASAIATRNGGELHLITVCEAADQQRAEDHLRDVVASLPQLQPKSATLRGTDVEKEICRYVDRVEADMLFVNSTGEPGPVKRDIIRSAGVPVMIVPAT